MNIGMYKELPLDISTWDEWCMQQFIKENAALFHVFISQYVKDADSIDDFLQEAYIRLWTHRKSIGEVASIRNYFYTIIYHVIIDKYNAFSPKPDDVSLDEIGVNIPVEENLTRNIIKAESSHLIAEAIRKLSPQSQKVIFMSLQGKTLNEIAEALNLSINTIKTIKYRALKRLSELLPREEFFILLILLGTFKC